MTRCVLLTVRAQVVTDELEIVTVRPDGLANSVTNHVLHTALYADATRRVYYARMVIMARTVKNGVLESVKPVSDRG